MPEIPLPLTLRTFVDCWCSAESSVQDLTREGHVADPDEEEITTLLYCELSKRIGIRNAENAFGRAFEADLREFGCWARSDTPARLGHGLIAQVGFPRRVTEAKIGGDLGITFQRPRLVRTGRTLSVESSMNGVLCQAKISRRNGDGFSGLSKKQCVILKDRLQHLAMLLYRRSEGALRSVSWLDCRKYPSPGAVNRTLKRGACSEQLVSREFFRLLSNGAIGTKNLDLISGQIIPNGSGLRRLLEIKIGGPGVEPGAVTTEAYAFRSEPRFVPQLQLAYVRRR